MVKRALVDLVLSNPSPIGATFPASSVLIEPPHLRKDMSRPGDIMALGMDVQGGRDLFEGGVEVASAQPHVIHSERDRALGGA